MFIYRLVVITAVLLTAWERAREKMAGIGTAWEEGREKRARIGGAILACGLFLAIAYWLWPDGITEQPLARLTLHDLAGAAFSLYFVYLAARVFDN